MPDQDKHARLDDFDQKCIQAHQAWVESGGNISVAARSLGVDRSTFRNRLEKYHVRDLGKMLPVEVDPGFEVKEHTTRLDANGHVVGESIKLTVAKSDEAYEVPTGHRVKGESVLTDANGNVISKWTKTTENGRSTEDIIEAARLAAEMHVSPAAPRLAAPHVARTADPHLLNLHQLPDLHIGLATRFETAQMDWGLETAIDLYRGLFENLVERSPWARTGVILGGGDMLHYDDPTKMTRKSGNLLQGEAPYPVVLAQTEALLVYHVELALEKYPRVLVRILEGNHDPDSAIAIAHYLSAWFHDEPRVEVDTDPSMFWFHQFGANMLGATHGHEAKIQSMPGIMAADRPQMWGATRFRYAHGFHIHHATRSWGEEGGAKWETHNTPVPRDDYHQGKHYRSERAISTITYHADKGERGRTQETLL